MRQFFHKEILNHQKAYKNALSVLKRGIDFVIEDERLSIIKVYASWCKTCKVFDVRYRKLANQMGDLSTGNVRFAEMQYDNPANEEMCKLLNATQLPYILIYNI